MWQQSILVVFISFCTALLGEGVTWLLCYRTDRYKSLKNEVDRQIKILEKLRELNVGLVNNKQHLKKLEREEEKLKNHNREMSLVKMKSMMVIGLAFTAFLSMFNSLFSGVVIAKLPFEPIGLIQGLSHRNLPGEDFTDCSFIFLYVLCTMSIRQNVQKFLGFSPSRAASKHANDIFAPRQ